MQKFYTESHSAGGVVLNSKGYVVVVDQGGSHGLYLRVTWKMESLYLKRYKIGILT
jgi:hypothetical protein